MGRIYTTWQAVKQAIAIRCAAHGFARSEEEAYPEDFGSRYATFSCEQAHLRLAWDGEEERFLLEWTRVPEAQGRHTDWQELTRVDFPSCSEMRTPDSVLPSLLPSVEMFLARFQEEPANPIVDLEGFYRSIRCLAVELRSEGHTKEADRLGILMSCSWTTGSELIGELMLSLEEMNDVYSKQSSRLISDCLHFAKHHRRILRLD